MRQCGKIHVEPVSSQMTIGRMRIASWIWKAKNTQSEYVIRLSIQVQQWLNQTLLNITLHVL